MTKVIGEGGQATVWSALDRLYRRKVAVKKFKKKDMDFKRLENAYNERKLMREVDHENVLKETSYFENNNYICMVSEQMDCDVRDKKTKMRDLMNENQARDIFKQMLKATAECHMKSIIHRDIKLDNFLLKEVEGEEGKSIVKLADFGIACKYDPHNPPT